MARKTTEEFMAEAHNNLLESIREANVAIRTNDKAALDKAMSDIKANEVDYARFKAWSVYKELRAADEDTMIAAVKRYSYTIDAHKDIREDGVVTGVEYAEREKRIDLVDMCKKLDMDLTWFHNVERFNQLLTMKSAVDENLPQDKINEIANSFYMSKVAKQLELGETPTSKTQLCKRVQEIVDMMIFVDNGEGKNTYKVNGHDVAYILNCHTSRGKSKGQVNTLTTKKLVEVILDMENCIITGTPYSIKYKQDKNRSAKTYAEGGEVKVTKTEATTKTK